MTVNIISDIEDSDLLECDVSLDECFRVFKLQTGNNNSSGAARSMKMKAPHSFGTPETTHNVTSQKIDICNYTAVITLNLAQQILLAEDTYVT
jgi:hypothetical protein